MTSADKNPVSQIEENKPVAWTPEDASRFLTSAIHEAQRPLADALKQRPITSKAFGMVIAILVAAALAIALILSSQLEKTEKRADVDRASRDAMFSEKTQIEASAAALEDRIADARQRQEALQGQIAGMRGSEDELRRARGDIQRFRRQNELLRNQIAGLEMEKTALSRQLEAVRALAIEDEGLEEMDLLDDLDEEPSGSGFGPVQTGREDAPASTPVPEADPVREESGEALPAVDDAALLPAEPVSEDRDGEEPAEANTEAVPARKEEAEGSDGETGDDGISMDDPGQDPAREDQAAPDGEGADAEPQVIHTL